MKFSDMRLKSFNCRSKFNGIACVLCYCRMEADKDKDKVVIQ